MYWMTFLGSLLNELEHPHLFQLEGNDEVAMVTLVSHTTSSISIPIPGRAK